MASFGQADEDGQDHQDLQSRAHVDLGYVGVNESRLVR
jgi:hypothetical protein